MVPNHGKDLEREEVVHRLLSKGKSTGADIHYAAAYRADTGFLPHHTPLAANGGRLEPHVERREATHAKGGWPERGRGQG